MSPALASDFNTAEARNHECGLGRTAGMTEAEQYMRRAIELAEKGRHRVMPNPLVGCVLVRDEEIVAEGWHDHLGGLHAEQMAIADAESKGNLDKGGHGLRYSGALQSLRQDSALHGVAALGGS